MREITQLARRIEGIGFRCMRCGRCCTAEPGCEGFVMLGPREVEQILQGTGSTWNQVAVPYPEFMEGSRGTRFTFSWCLRCTGGRCSFLREGECAIYADRPWICRTYPFMLEGDTLQVSACEGIGQRISPAEAEEIARDLIARRKAEADEEESLRRILADLPALKQGAYVIDSRGVTPGEF